MNRPRAERLRSFAAIAGFIACAFALSISCEISIAAANARSETAQDEIAKAKFAVEHLLTMSGQGRELERSIAMLHLHDSSAQQCAVVISELEHLGTRNGLRVMAVVRDVAPFVAQRPGSQSDTYQITLYGAYRKTLLALANVADMPLVANIKSVTFDRLPAGRSAGDEVRTSIQLEVFRMIDADAARPS